MKSTNLLTSYDHFHGHPSTYASLRILLVNIPSLWVCWVFLDSLDIDVDHIVTYAVCQYDDYVCVYMYNSKNIHIICVYVDISIYVSIYLGYWQFKACFPRPRLSLHV